MCKNKELKQKLQEFTIDNLSEEVFEEFIQDINSQIPEELKEYYYSKCKSMGMDDFVPQISEEEIENIANLEFDEKIKIIAKESSANQKKIIETLQSDKEKLEVMQLETIPFDIKSEMVKTLQSDDSKIKALRENEFYDYYYEEVISTFQDDRKKLEALDLVKKETGKLEIIQSMEDEGVKVESLSQLREDYDKAEIILSLEDEANLINSIDKLSGQIEEIKTAKSLIEKISNLQDDNTKMKLLGKLSDRLVGSYNYDYKLAVIDILTEDENKLKVIDTMFHEEDKSTAAIRLEKDENKLKVISELQDENCKTTIAKKLVEDESKLKVINELQDEQCRITIAKGLEKDENKLKLISQMQEESKVEVAKSIKADKLKSEALKYFENEADQISIIRTYENVENVYKGLRELGIDEERINTLKKLYEKNNEVILEINLDLLDEKYINTLGEDKINFISNFEDIQDNILQLSDKEYEVFYKCINNYIERTGTDEWSVLANQILETIGENQYSELIENIENLEDVNLEQLTKIMQDDNDFDIETVEDIENYSEIKKNKCREMLESDIDIKQKKTYVFQKIFGHSMKYAENIVEKYGKCIHKIKDKGLKDYVESIQLILLTENEEVLKEISDNLNEIEFFVDKVKFERDLKTEYGKLYNEGLFNPENEAKMSQEELSQIEVKDETEEEVDLAEELKGLNVYDAGTDFKMLVTSVAPYVDRNKKIPDYKVDWNRLAVGSPHFCASYIRQDMIGCAPIPHVAYGFSSMSDEALMLSGSSDIASTGEAFVSEAHRKEKEVYNDTDTQINETTFYNEMDYRRIQNGEKKQPDYIIAFKIEGKIENLEDIKQAYNDWEGKIPIVVVDVDKCIKEEERKTEELIEKFDRATDEIEKTELAREITQKVRNNQVTLDVHYNFGKRENNDRLHFYEQDDVEKWEKLNNVKKYYENNRSLLYEKFKKDKVEEQELEEIYEELTPTERDEVMGSIRSIIERQTEKEGERGYD